MLLSLFLTCVAAVPTIVDQRNNVTYNGLTSNGLDVFRGIRFGEDTSGQNRFKPPRPHNVTANSVVDATNFGAACPQPPNSFAPPITLTNVTNTSEDCLNLDITRPNDTVVGSKLPVMVFIHGGSFWTGSTQEITTRPDGLVLQSIENGLPVMHVAMNYRLGGEYTEREDARRLTSIAFGFAQNKALYDDVSLNAGLRDQRLAIEWVRDNIAAFGGDPKKITIFGQSSGGKSTSNTLKRC